MDSGGIHGNHAALQADEVFMRLVGLVFTQPTYFVASVHRDLSSARSAARCFVDSRLPLSLQLFYIWVCPRRCMQTRRHRKSRRTNAFSNCCAVAILLFLLASMCIQSLLPVTAKPSFRRSAT